MTSHRRTPPLAQMKSRFGDKAKLAAEVQSLATDSLWLDKVSADKGLGRVSNAKLLRLHALLTRAHSEFGSREKLVEAILGLQNRAKDVGWRGRLEGYPLPRLLDLHDVSARRRKSLESKSAVAPVPRKRVARTKKAKLKAAEAAAAS